MTPSVTDASSSKAAILKVSTGSLLETGQVCSGSILITRPTHLELVSSATDVRGIRRPRLRFKPLLKETLKIRRYYWNPSAETDASGDTWFTGNHKGQLKMMMKHFIVIVCSLVLYHHQA